jgi:Tfp pilus assembly protein PilO
MAKTTVTEQQKEWAIKISAGVVTLILCYAMMISPVLASFPFLIHGIRNSQQRIQLYHDIRDLKQNLEKSESSLPALTERSQLLGKITDVASRNKIRIQTLTPTTEPEGGYVRLRVEMDGQGSFLSLIKFLQSVEKMGAAVKVKDVSALWKPAPDSKDRAYSLQLQISFETFLKQRVKRNV